MPDRLTPRLSGPLRMRGSLMVQRIKLVREARDLCRQIREGRRMPKKGPGLAARLLRLPGRTLETPAHPNPIESTFATVRHRTIRSKGWEQDRARYGVQAGRRRAEEPGAALTATTMPTIIRGVKFTDGCEVIAKPGDLQSQTAA